MRSKGLIGLIVAAVIAVIIAIVVSSGGNRAASDPLMGTAVLPDLTRHSGDIAQVALVQGGVKTTFERDGDHWAVAEKGRYPADATKVGHLLFGLKDLRYVEPKTRKPGLYSRLELEDPATKDAKSTLVTASDAKGTVLGAVIVGKRRADELGSGSDGVYVRNPNDAQSWLARGSLDVSGDIASWLDRRIVDVPELQVRSVLLTHADGSKLTIARDKADDAFRLAELPKDKKLKSEGILNETAGALAGLELSDVRPAQGFDVPKDGIAHAQFTTFDGLVVAIDFFAKDNTTWARVSATGSGPAEKEAADITARVGPWVYGIAEFQANLLKTRLADVIEAPKPS